MFNTLILKMNPNFGYCVWYKLHPSHPYNRVIRHASSVLQTPVFNAHITIVAYMRALYAAKTIKLLYERKPRPTFQVRQIPAVTRTNHFHAIQYNLDTDQGAGWHTSVAYRVGQGFSSQDYMKVFEGERPNVYTITPDDYSVVLMNCSARNPEDWFEIK